MKPTHAISARRKPRILIVTPYYPPHVGGVENYVQSVASHLAREHGWRVTVLTTTKYNYEQKEVTDDITILRLPYTLVVSNTPIGVRWSSAIQAIIERERPDIINVHAPVPGIADITTKIAKNIPVVVTYHAGRNITKRGISLDCMTTLYEGWLVHVMLKKSTHIISSSEFVKKTILSPYAKKTTTITPGVDLLRFSPKKVAPGAPLLFVGSLNKAERYKGLEYLLEAVAILRKQGTDVKLVVAGDGSFRGWYEQLTQTLGISDLVTFKGRVQGEPLVSLYRQCALYVHPSTFDSCPLTVLEAMACGKPVLGSKASGVPYMIEVGVDGMLAEAANAPSLAEHIHKLLSSPKQLERMGKAARKKVELKHDWKIIASQTNKQLRQILSAEGREVEVYKVAILAPYLYPHRGGVEKYIDEITKRLSANHGWKVLFITTQEGVETNFKHGRDADTYKLSYRLKFSNTPISMLWRSQIKEILIREKPDVINGHTPVPFLADTGAQVAGNIPFVLSYHNDIVKDNPVLNFFAKVYNIVLGRATLESSKSIVVSSIFYAENSPVLAPYRAKTTIISPGVDLKRFHAKVPTSAVRAKLGQDPYILFVGQLAKTHRHKGLQYLIPALAEVRKTLPKLKLVVIGEGDAMEDYKKQARSVGVGDSVVFTGPVSEDELPGYYTAAQALVLPSTNASEGFGMVLVEAAACETPAIGSRVGGIPYVIVDGKTGLLVPPADVDALSKAILRLVQDKRLLAEYGKQARARAEKLFSWDAKAAQYDTLLKEQIQ